MSDSPPATDRADSSPSDGADAAGGSSGPTDPDERIVSLDALRGFALLGILVINVQFFGMPMIAAVFPPGFGDFTGWNYLAWLVGHVLFEGKFVTLFTLMFGAGIVLFTAGKERRGEPALRLHYRRTLWLLAIGLGHAHLLWYGDILVVYALCGLAAVFARQWSPRQLLTVGLVLFAVPSLLYVSAGAFLVDSAGEEEATDILAGLGDTEAEIDAYRGGWTDQMEHRSPTAFELQTVGFASETGWRIGGLMLVGMALFKLGVLSNRRSKQFYRRLLLVGGAVGLALVLAGVWYNERVGWNATRVLLFGSQFNYWGSLPLAGAYVAAVMLWCRRRAGGVVTNALAAVGRTAFSNYLLQTVLATSIFYGHGLGLFGSLNRVELLGVVVVIWAIQIPLSVAWLRRFRFGPLEWLWRTLTYGERQPIRAE